MVSLNPNLPSSVSYLRVFTPSVDPPLQAHATYFCFNNAFDFVPHTLLLHTLSALGLPGGYVIWFRSYITNRHTHSPVSGSISPLVEVQSVVSQGYILEPLLFSVC
jgi:hypothetical protein